MRDKQLLSAMFADTEEFREELLSQTLRHTRRKRRVRYAGRALLILAIATSTVLWTLPHRTTFNSAPSLVGGVPAEPQTALQVVATSHLSGEQIITTDHVSVTIISTDQSSLALVGDDQLLHLVPGETKLLVWHGPHQAELVILGP